MREGSKGNVYRELHRLGTEHNEEDEFAVPFIDDNKMSLLETADSVPAHLQL